MFEKQNEMVTFVRSLFVIIRVRSFEIVKLHPRCCISGMESSDLRNSEAKYEAVVHLEES